MHPSSLPPLSDRTIPNVKHWTDKHAATLQTRLTGPPWLLRDRPCNSPTVRSPTSPILPSLSDLNIAIDLTVLKIVVNVARRGGAHDSATNDFSRHVQTLQSRGEAVETAEAKSTRFLHQAHASRNGTVPGGRSNLPSLSSSGFQGSPDVQPGRMVLEKLVFFWHPLAQTDGRVGSQSQQPRI